MGTDFWYRKSVAVSKNENDWTSWFRFGEESKKWIEKTPRECWSQPILAQDIRMKGRQGRSKIRLNLITENVGERVHLLSRCKIYDHPNLKKSSWWFSKVKGWLSKVCGWKNTLWLTWDEWKSLESGYKHKLLQSLNFQTSVIGWNLNLT